MDTLTVKNHTRSDFPDSADIITLVEYIQKVYFTKAIHWICEVCGYAYYDGYENKDEIGDPCLKFLDEIETKNKKYDDEVLKKLDKKILNEYMPYANTWFYEDGIPIDIQQLFEVGFCVRDECITIPIRDENGFLVGVKARTIRDYEMLGVSKYWYIHPVPKSKILYGLDKSYSYIREAGFVIVYEAEKSVQKSFSYGFCNCVSIGGHELGEEQVIKLERLGVDIVFAFDKMTDNETGKDITGKMTIKEAQKFMIKDRLYAIIEFHNKGILKNKDAPVDAGRENFIKLYTTDKHKIPQ